MKRHEMTRHRQADAQAAPRLVGAGREHLEHPRQHLGRDTASGIADRDDDMVIGHHPRQPDPAPPIGVFDRVVENVRKHLFEPQGVAMNPARAGRQPHVQLLSAQGGRWSQRFGEVEEHVVEIDVLLLSVVISRPVRATSSRSSASRDRRVH
jgi:hypothetical protein